jgi:hypothetical protein
LRLRGRTDLLPVLAFVMRHCTPQCLILQRRWPVRGQPQSDATSMVPTTNRAVYRTTQRVGKKRCVHTHAGAGCTDARSHLFRGPLALRGAPCGSSGRPAAHTRVTMSRQSPRRRVRSTLEHNRGKTKRVVFESLTANSVELTDTRTTASRSTRLVLDRTQTTPALSTRFS